MRNHILCIFFGTTDNIYLIKMRKSSVLTLGFVLSVFFVRAQSGVVSNFDSYTTPAPDRTYELKGTGLLFEKTWAHGRVELPDHKILQNDSLFPITTRWTKPCWLQRILEPC
jgi:hypothetical protein